MKEEQRYFHLLSSVTGTGHAGTGNADGKLYYEVPGVGPLYSKEDIVWINQDYRQSHIRELWLDYFCGGTSCGTTPNDGTVSFARAVVTRGLPDMTEVQHQVDTLNQQEPWLEFQGSKSTWTRST